MLPISQFTLSIEIQVPSLPPTFPLCDLCFTLYLLPPLGFNRLFNVKSTFDENLYTTPLNKNALTNAQMAHAERMAAEIEGKTSNNIHMREERNMVGER